MANIQFSVFSKPWKTQSLAELGERVRTLGYDGIEFPVRPGYQVEPENIVRDLPPAAKTLAQFGVRIFSVAGPTDEATIVACAEAGVPIIRTMARIEPGERYTEAEERYRREYSALLPLLEKHGVCIGVQNHMGRFVTHAVGLRALLQGFDPKYVAAVWDAARALAADMGIDIIATEEHAATTISEMESLTRVKAMNPDVLYISSTPQPTSIIVQNAVALGMYPGVTIGCGHASLTSVLVELAGSDAEGIYGVYPTVNWGDDVPAMDKMTEYCQELHPEDYGNMDYITSWAEGLIVAEILRLAVENVGIDNLTPQAVEEYGFKALDGFSAGGLHGPVTYTPGDNRLSKSVRVFQVEDGDIVPISGWIEAPLIKYEDFDWFS